MKKFHYVYKITNNINNHYYFGVHNTDNLNDGYMGSGHRLKLAYEKYGIENFSKEIIKFFNTSEEAYQYEKEIVNINVTKLPECYNIVEGGKYFSGGIKNMVCVKEKNDKTDTYFLIERNIYMQNRNKYDTTWTGRHHNESTKQHIRNTMTPKNSSNTRVWINKDGVVKYLRKELLDEYILNGWQLGRTNYKPRKNSQGKEIKFDI